MSEVIAALSRHVSGALSDGERSIAYPELAGIVADIGRQLRASGARTVGIALDNSPLWAALDLGVLSAGLICVPLPGFFSPSQLAHVIHDAGIDTIMTDRKDFFLGLLDHADLRILEREHCGRKYAEIHCRKNVQAQVPAGTAKITYTSGTTGQPKGVCLGCDAIERVAKSLLQASGANADDRYLSVLPLSTLLENIGGVYVPLLAGATCHLPPPEKVGLQGAAKLDAVRMANAFRQFRATSAILTPQLLQALMAQMEAGLPDLRFLAVGGAPVSMRLLERAAELGLPVFEGYGLSECASVVSLNTAGSHRMGSAGKPLPHVSLKFAGDGEIFVKGAVMLGYCGADNREDYWPSGDTGYLDEDGFLYLTGRKKNMFITSFGRNVAPEWVEKELTRHGAIMQAAVFGEGKPWNTAVVVPRDPACVGEAVREANRDLPDYARIGKWLVADEPFLPENGQMTANGRLKRDAIWPLYREKIDALYEEKS
ncbi:MAG: AMP-binding protein [Burkholderiales bacterium]|nr:AMP-binding protein [Burkholderiales bacterium]